ncbi:MAG: methylamine utilization protein [Caulobacter sp.]|nr:methylamine utilization protein [Caulobacter sp.]
MRLLLFCLCVLLAPVPALAGDLVMTVRDGAGRPVPNVVVMVRPAAGVPAGPIRFPWPYTVAQQNIQFDPFVLVVPVGATVGFPNKDKVRHHVYSFSAGNKFELKLFGKDETRSVVFKAVGVAAIGCNIHDAMVGFIRVVDTPWAIKTGADGVATLRGVPAGAATVTVWHPYLRAPKNEVVRKSVFTATGALRESVAIELRAAAPMAGMAH